MGCTNSKVAPINFCDIDDVINQPSTSYPREKNINSEEFLAYERFLASTLLDDSDSDFDDDDNVVKQKQPSMSYPPGKIKKSCDILVIDHGEDEDNSAHITQIKTRPGGVAFEVANNFDHITDVTDVKVSRGGVAFEITADQSLAPSAEVLEMSLPSSPITTVSCTRHAKEGIAFEIDFSDNEEQNQQLKTLSKVTSLIAKYGWSEHDIIKESDDVWVANKVLAMNDNAKRNEKRLASLRKAEEEFDLMTATMTERALDSFHYFLVKETCTEHSLLRRAQFKAWQKKMMQ
ncbi:uncharacterized protein LOC121406786 [Lytechinus variegatus]|uniref:uncharacterized protein LOC121406786 n=1 Tax=Lytechinus variegatus TaxID=7654 RepID=UPI001BB2C106|nr:uncharacterized protein LOC121406786 [Lytechinus variegatus]